MKLVIDTNAYCLCDLGNEVALSFLEEAKYIFLPVIVFGELYYGFKHGARLHENLRRLEKFVDSFNVQTIPVDLSVARNFGDLYSALRKKGKPIPTNDIWIASCCQAVGGVLLTADTHFKNVDSIEAHYLEE